jgi:GST-like protein
VYELYTWGTPNGRKVSIALEELALDYKVKAINITKDEQFAPDFLAISPNNKIPALVDTKANFALMESGAILIYLADKVGELLPPSGEERYEVLQWLMMQMGSVGPMLGQTHHFVKFNKGKSAYAEERYASETNRIYGVLDKQLSTSQFLTKSFSIADIATWPWISRFEWQEIDFSKYPNLLRWYLELADRPATQRGYDVPQTGAEIPRP